MDRIQAQAAKLWRLLFSSDTVATYQKTLIRTWEILKESALLVWLIFCLVFVLVDWVWRSSAQLAAGWKTWYSNLEEPSVNTFLSATGKAVLSAGESSVDYVLSQAKGQLGIEDTVKPAKRIAVQPVESSKPAVSASTPPKVSTPSPVDDPKSTDKPSDNTDPESTDPESLEI